MSPELSQRAVGETTAWHAYEYPRVPSIFGHFGKSFIIYSVIDTHTHGGYNDDTNRCVRIDLGLFFNRKREKLYCVDIKKHVPHVCSNRYGYTIDHHTGTQGIGRARRPVRST